MLICSATWRGLFAGPRFAGPSFFPGAATGWGGGREGRPDANTGDKLMANLHFIVTEAQPVGF